jgi:AcrR family transcriptional regulator
MREQVTAAILDAAEAAIAERGFEGASTAAIASRAGVAVGTLYNYFPDRESLIDSLFDARRAEILPRLHEAARTAGKAPADRRLRTYLAEVTTVLDEQRRFFQVVFAVDPEPRHVKGKKPVLLTTMSEALVHILRPTSGKRGEEHAQMVLGAMKAIVHWRVERGERFAADGELIANAFLHGIGKR